MDFNALNGPKMTDAQIDAYLARIGLTAPVPLTLEGLSALQIHHLYDIPFENLDILAGIPLSLELDALFEKLIVRRRGGVCAELNTLFNWLLYSLGFDVTSYSARVAYPNPIQFRRHRIMGVRLPEGLYLTDVGINLEYSRKPLLLQEGLVQSDGHCQYKLERDDFFGWLQWQHTEERGWQKQIGFTLEPQIDLDFILPMYYYETNPTSMMKLSPRVSLYTREGVTAVRNHIFYREVNGSAVERREIPTIREERQLIRELFGLEMVWSGRHHQLPVPEQGIHRRPVLV